jgi:prepilin-type N-terminal cleavage/methylation domain-containing protein
MRRPPERHARPGTRVRTAGFTLLELMIVLLIMGAVAAVAVPMAVPRQASGTAATEQDLVGIFAAARREAVARATATTLHLELTSGTFVLLAERSTSPEADTLRVGAIRLPPGVSLAGGRQGWARAAFDALGRTHGDRLYIIAEGERRELLLDLASAARPLR